MLATVLAASTAYQQTCLASKSFLEHILGLDFPNCVPWSFHKCDYMIKLRKHFCLVCWIFLKNRTYESNLVTHWILNVWYGDQALEDIYCSFACGWNNIIGLLLVNEPGYTHWRATQGLMQDTIVRHEFCRIEEKNNRYIITIHKALQKWLPKVSLQF